MSKIRSAVCLAALAILTLPAAAQVYPPARVDRSALTPAPAPLDHFLETLRGLHATGAFDAGQGITPRAELGGLGAKAWLLDHVAPEFRCLSDFGGTCPEAQGPHAHIARFLARFGDGTGDFDAIARDGPPDLAPVGFDLHALLPAFTLFTLEEGLLCTPQAVSDSSDALELALTDWSGDDLLVVLDRLRAVMGRYNIRAAPSITAPVLLQTEDAILYFPAPRIVTEEPHDPGAAPFRWREVLLPDGRTGYVAPEDADLLEAGGLGEQVCFDIHNDQPRIRLHVGGGD